MIRIMLTMLISLNLYAGDQEIISGDVLNQDDYKEVVLIKPVGCTATLVGPRVLVTAAHCAKKANVTFNTNGKQYSAKLTQSRSVSHDMALGIISEPVDDVKFAHIDPIYNVELKTPVDLVGYGCTRWKSAVGYGVLRVGWSEIFSYSARDNEFVARGASAICQGDSGGPAFIPNTRVLIGIHSKGNGVNSYEVRLDSKVSKDFLNVFISTHNVLVCGINSSCQ